MILIPEIPYRLEAVCEEVERRSRQGRRFSIVVVAEGAKPVGGRLVVERRVEGSPDPIRLGGSPRSSRRRSSIDGPRDAKRRPRLISSAADPDSRRPDPRHALRRGRDAARGGGALRRDGRPQGRRDPRVPIARPITRGRRCRSVIR